MVFDSGVSIASVLTEVRDEFERMTEYDENVYTDWYNAIISFLYGDIIKEQARAETDFKAEIALNEMGENVRKEDVYAVFADGVQLLEVNPFNAKTLKNSFYHSNGKIHVFAEDKYKDNGMAVVYFIRPDAFYPEKADEAGNVPLPIEFLDLVRYKLRAEACKRAGENNHLVKWTNEFNYLLESFKVWLSNRAPGFGM